MNVLAWYISFLFLIRTWAAAVDDVASSTAAFASSTTSYSSNSKWAPLNDILSELVIPVGNFTTKVKVKIIGTVNIELHNIVCKGISLNDLAVLPVSNPLNTVETTTLHIAGINLVCTAVYDVKDGIITQHGDMTATSTASAATLSLSAKTKNPGKETFEYFPPFSSRVVGCDSKIVISKLSLSGFLKLAEGVVRSKLNEMINPIVCNEIASLNTTVLAPLLRNVSKLLLEKSPYDRTGDIRWRKEENIILEALKPFAPNDLRSNPVVRTLNVLVHFFLDQSSCGLPNGINQFIQSQIKKQNSGQRDGLNISFGKRGISVAKLTGNPVTDILVNLTSVFIKGLDTFTNINLFEPISVATMNTTMELNGPLQVDIGMTVVLAPKKNAKPFVERVIVSLPSVEGLLLQWSTALALKESFYGSMPLAELFHSPLGCSVRGVQTANLTAATLTASKVKGALHVKGMISPDVDTVLASLGESVAHMYEGTLLEGGGMNNLIDNTILPAANGLLHDSIKKLIGSTSTAICNGSSVGPRPVPTKPPVDLSASIPVAILRNLVEDVLFPNVNAIITNATCGIKGEHGRMDQKGWLFGPKTMVVKNYDLVPQIGNVTLGLSNFTLEHLDTISTLRAFDTPAKTRMDGKFVIAPSASKPLRISLDVLLKVKRIPGTNPADTPSATNPNGDVEDQFRIGVTLNNLTLSIASIVAIDGYSFGALPLRATTCLSCWLGTLDAFEILTGFNNIASSNREELTDLGSDLVSFDLACNKNDADFVRVDDQLYCSSPLMPEFIRRTKEPRNVQEFSKWVGKGIGTLITHFQTETFRSQMKSVLEKRRADGAEGCMDDPFFAPVKPWIAPQCVPTKAGLISLGVVGGLILIYFGALFFVHYFQVEHQRKRCMCKGCCCSCVNFCLGKSCKIDIFWCRRIFCRKKGNNKVQRSGGAILASLLPRGSAGRDESGQFHQEALLFHPAIPQNVRYGMLVLIFINIVLFFTDHALTAASVNVGIKVLGDAFLDQQAFPFGLGYTLVDMWKACAVLLLGFMGTFSGAWPYLKLLIMSALWCAPPAMLDPRTRGRYFHMLDVMGKWSLLDLYVLTQAMVAFYIQIKNPELNIFPKDFYSLQVYITPVYGLYSFCFAVILSLVLSHVQVIYHLNAVTADAWMERRLDEPLSSEGRRGRASSVESQSSEVGETMPLSWMDVGLSNSDTESVLENALDFAHVDNPGRSKIMRLLRCRTGARKYTWFIALVVLVAISLMLVGAFVTSWTFITHGVAGLITELGGGATVRPYSLSSAFGQLLNQSMMGGKLGIGTFFITLVYIMFAFVIPLAHMITLLFLWYRRLTLCGLKKLFLATKVLSAFSALEVWVLGTVFTILQIKFVSYEVLDYQCTSIKPIFQALVDFGFIVQDDGNCFQIDGEFHWFGLGLMFLSAALGHFISLTVLVEAGKSVKRREHRVLHWSPRTGVCYSVVERKQSRGSVGDARSDLEGIKEKIEFGGMEDILEDEP